MKPCLCSHPHHAHAPGRFAGHCGVRACGCRYYRPDEAKKATAHG